MKIDTEHLHYWMMAIRQSPYPMRTLDAFWRGQVTSKEWLIEQLTPLIEKPVTIDIHGGWVGLLASMLFQSEIPINYIYSTDIDPTCEPIATMMNKQEQIDGKFQAITADICNVFSFGDVIINTSCEHMSQDQYDTWLQHRNKDALIVIQSNNYDLPEHIRTAKSLEEFKNQSNINSIWSGSLSTQMYDRWMIMGYKNI